MKILTLIKIAFSSGTILAHGWLLDSELAFSQRFDQPVSKAKEVEFGSRMIRYSKDGWFIRAWFINDQCQKISYSKIPATRPTADQINAFMASNSGGQTWALEKDKITAASIILPSVVGRHFVRSDKEAYCETSTSVTLKRRFGFETKLVIGKKEWPSNRLFHIFNVEIALV